jgi:hypothetical protein
MRAVTKKIRRTDLILEITSVTEAWMGCTFVLQTTKLICMWYALAHWGMSQKKKIKRIDFILEITSVTEAWMGCTFVLQTTKLFRMWYARL